MKNLLLTCLLGFISLTSTAQQTYEWEDLFEELYASSEENVDAKEETFELLADLSMFINIMVCSHWASWL